MIKSKKKYFFIGFVALILIGFLTLIGTREHDSSDEVIEENEIVVAGCPTFYRYLEQIENEIGFETLKTGSTGDSLEKLFEGNADILISGRALRPEEPALRGIVIGEGFSFISENSMQIYSRNLGEFDLYTDLESKKVASYFESIEKEYLEEVEDVYKKIEKGIAITSVDNTDYSRSEVLHVYEDYKTRHRFSRAPILYFDPEKIDESIINQLKNTF